MTGVDRNGRDAAQERISSLLAETANEVETGVAPVDAVVRAGRRHRARRRTATAVAAVVLAGTTGTLALTSLPGGTAPAPPPSPLQRTNDACSCRRSRRWPSALLGT